MTFDIKKLARAGEFGMELNSLGHAIFVSLNTTHLSQAEKKLAASDVRSLDFVQWLFGEMARQPVDDLSDEHDPENNPRFTAQELTAATDAELEEFADKLALKNKYFLLKTHEGDNIEKLIDESACDFLVRAFRHYAAEQKAHWKRMTQCSSTTTGAMQQSALATIAEANRYATANSATAAIERILKRDQDFMRAIDPLKDIRVHLEENSAGVVIAMHFKREQELMRAATSSLQIAQHFSEQNSTSAILAKAIYHNKYLIREAALGLAQRDSMSEAMAIEVEKQRQVTRDLLINHEAMFRLPQAFEATHLLDSYQIGAVAALAQGHAKDLLDQQRFLDAITPPWLNRLEEARSVTGILELQGIGKALRTMKGFDLDLTVALRSDLGDWRDKINFPDSVFIDPIARTDFYVNRGFNTALTDFPEHAFHRGLEVAGLDGETLDIEFFRQVVESSVDPEKEAGLQRTNKCHDRLQRFERQLRHFINDAMTAQYGPDWPRKRLDPKLYENWEFKKQRAESNGIIITFIDVADFTDYETIICKQDHWREVFETRFKKKESVRESLQRLQPIRLTAMHGRIVTKEDELYLVAEVLRILSAIK